MGLHQKVVNGAAVVVLVAWVASMGASMVPTWEIEVPKDLQLLGTGVTTIMLTQMKRTDKKGDDDV